MVQKLGSVLTVIKPEFMKYYDLNVRICIQDMVVATVDET
jgi:hypothetical protein